MVRAHPATRAGNESLLLLWVNLIAVDVVTWGHTRLRFDSPPLGIESAPGLAEARGAPLGGRDAHGLGAGGVVASGLQSALEHLLEIDVVSRPDKPLESLQAVGVDVPLAALPQGVPAEKRVG